MLSEMEREGMRNGCFPMDKDEGIAACREYRKKLEDQGHSTWLEYFTGDLFRVRYDGDNKS